jgi:hypothetical protein
MYFFCGKKEELPKDTSAIPVLVSFSYSKLLFCFDVCNTESHTEWLIEDAEVLTYSKLKGIDLDIVELGDLEISFEKDSIDISDLLIRRCRNLLITRPFFH